MSHTVSRFFTKDDLTRIQNAVQEAESHSAGEIVPYVVDHSDAYEEAEWRCAVMLSAFALALLAFLHSQTSVWLPFDVAEMAIAVIVAGGVGMGIIRASGAARRFFAGHRLIERRVAQRAAEAFVSEEVFNTRDRSGILIFLSLLEHRVMVVGDTGINARVKAQEWHAIVKTIVDGIVAGRPAEGLIEGIRQSGALLALKGVERRPDDRDELPDSLRMSDH
jgi:putative membrane protein